jgi:hypothetical protein
MIEGHEYHHQTTNEVYAHYAIVSCFLSHRSNVFIFENYWCSILVILKRHLSATFAHMAKDFVILGKTIAPGESAQVYLDVAKLHTRTDVKVPIIIERAEAEGPVVLFLGGLHGDETNGVEIVRRIIRSGVNKPVCGTTISIPVFNIFGFLNLSRQFPDGRDLNRQFPGALNGSLAARFAWHFTKSIAPLVDYVIDFHTGSADRINAPQIRCNFEETDTFNLAEHFGAPFIIHSEYIPKSVRHTLFKMGKTTLLFEGGKTNQFDEPVIACGVHGAENIMRYLGMKSKHAPEKTISVIVKKSKWVRAPHSGMFQMRIQNGTWVKKRSLLGIVTDPFGEFENRVYAPNDGFIFGVNSAPIVNRGDALFHLSTVVKEESVEL